MQKQYILDKVTADKKLKRIALEIAERNIGETEIIIAGIKENGSIIGDKISNYLKDIFSGKLTQIEISIDKRNPGHIEPISEANFNSAVVILVDDVANSGRTMLYALRPFLAFYPKKIQTVALVERTHKSFPVDVDYVGLSISTALDEHITVEVENGEVTGAWVS